MTTTRSRRSAGPAGPSARARSTRSSAGCTARCATLEHLVRADVAARRERHQVRFDASRSRWSTCTTSTTGPSASSSASCCARRSSDKERAGRPDPLQFVVLDELNKYAPRDGTSPIKEILLDVAERGRSLGIDPDRRAADGERGRAPDRGQLGASGSSAGSMRPRPVVANTGSCPRCNASGPRSSSRARCWSASPSCRCRS